MPTLQELMDQRAALDLQIAETKRSTHAAAVAQVRAIMDEFHVTIADLNIKAAPARSAGKGVKVAAKYSDNQGNTWSGRGLQPKWLKAQIASGKTLADFAV